MTGDPFDILGLEPAFDLDAAALQRAYLRRSAVLHPDHAGEETEAQAAALNDARAALENPERRAEILLKRLGGPAREEDRTLPPAFLSEIMSIREQIEEDQAAGDPSRMDHWERWAQERRRGHISEVGKLLNQALEAARQGRTPDPEVLRAVRRELNVWRYTERLLEQLDPDAGPGL